MTLAVATDMPPTSHLTMSNNDIMMMNRQTKPPCVTRKTAAFVELEFNVPFQHKYGYIRDEKSGMESYPYPVKEG